MTKTLAILVVCVSLFLTLPTFAEVSAFKVFADSQITQTRDGLIEHRLQDSKGFPATESTTPVIAKTSSPVESLPEWAAFNRVVSNEPQYNQNLPTDFIFETAAASAVSDVNLALSSTARQTRTINVLESEFPTFDAGTTLNLQSSFLLDGSLIAVVPEGTTSAEGLKLDFGLQLTKNDAELWAGTVSLIGKSDGTVEAATTGDFNASDFTVRTLELPDLADIYVLQFNDADLQYDYLAAIGDSFELEAQLSLDMDIPGGLGGGSAFGTVPAEIIQMAEDVFGDIGIPQAAAAAPEPASMAILALGSLIGLGRRRRQG